MMSARQTIHTIFLVLLPAIVALFGLSIWSAIGLILATLIWRWLIVISYMFFRDQRPKMVLETIAASHFAEKARWCMDRLELDYEETHSAGVLGVIFTGRTVPRLNFRTGIVRSSLGNSADILRYLWGRYSASLETASFLEPTEERLELEKRLDRVGHNLQLWIYYHLLDEREMTLRIWGANSSTVPAWQRLAMRALYPFTAFYLRKTFSISEKRYASSSQHIANLLAEADVLLADGRRSILGGDTINYTDICFASIMGLWLQPPEYGGSATAAVRVSRNQLPVAMRADIEQWSDDYPRATEFILRMYSEERT